MAEYRYIYDSVPESETKLLDDLVTILAKESVDKKLTNSVMLAASEAFNNAIIHGNGLNQAKKVTVALIITEDELIAEISDEGNSGLLRIKQKKPPELLSEGGRGVDLIIHYASCVDFSQLPGGGLKVSLRFSRNLEKTTS